jgi:hypothetical protein
MTPTLTITRAHNARSAIVVSVDNAIARHRRKHRLLLVLMTMHTMTMIPMLSAATPMTMSVMAMREAT